MLLPLYKDLEVHIKSCIAKHNSRSRNDTILRHALTQGLGKLQKHLKIALKNKYILLGAGKQPKICPIVRFIYSDLILPYSSLASFDPDRLFRGSRTLAS